MFSLVKKLMVLGLLSGSGLLVVHTTLDGPNYPDAEAWQSSFIEEVMLNSSRFSREDDLRSIDPSTIIEIGVDDVFMLENDNFMLYLNEDTLAFKIFDKTTNYVWATGIDTPEAGVFNGMLQSGIGIEYVNLLQNYALRENVGLLDTSYTVDVVLTADTVTLNINVGHYCATRNCNRFYEDYLEGRYTLEQMIGWGLTELGVLFTLNVTLTEEGIVAEIPYDSIEEENIDWTQLTSIILFPSLGATKLDDTPGYMVIPDGVGALIRYEDNKGQFLTPYEERFYDLDSGVVSQRLSVTSYSLSMPIFGAVHGVYQNAFLGIIESGELSARLLAFPNGARNIPYNLIFPKFDLKRTYRQSFTSDGRGGSMRIFASSNQNIRVNYKFLANNQADYVGIALTYQDYLVKQDVLNRLVSIEEAIPIHIQYLMADSKRRFIGKTIIPMSRADEVQMMYDHFVNAGLTHQRVSLLGWKREGYSANVLSSLRFERSLGNIKAFESLIKHITTDNTLMLVNNYIDATESSNVSYRNDVAQGINRIKLERYCSTCVYRERYLLNPSATNDYALNDFEYYRDLGVQVLFERLGSTLFSYYQKGFNTRQDAIMDYQEIIETYQNIGSYYSPHAWAWDSIADYYHTPLYNSQLSYFDDLVPLLPIVLRGHAEMYANFLNFNSLGHTHLLRLIDFGINPSYLLSAQRSSNLIGTDIENFYATQFLMWEKSVIEEYEYVNDALKHVLNARILKRQVHGLGLVEISYDSGVRILVNYSSQSEDIAGYQVNAMDYRVIGVTP